MAQKRPNLVQNMHFWSFWAKYWHFLPILSNAHPKNNANKVPMWVFGYVGNNFFISPVKIRIFCPKTTKFGPKLAFLFIFGQALPAHLVHCWWVGWWFWRAGCISQDTYLLYFICQIHEDMFPPPLQYIGLGKLKVAWAFAKLENYLLEDICPRS